MLAGVEGAVVGGAGEFSVGDGLRIRHTVLETGVHSFTSSSQGLHLNVRERNQRGSSEICTSRTRRLKAAAPV